MKMFFTYLEPQRQLDLERYPAVPVCPYALRASSEVKDLCVLSAPFGILIDDIISCCIA